MIIHIGPYSIALVELALSLFALAALAVNAIFAVGWLRSLRPRRNRYLTSANPRYLPRPRPDCVVREPGEFYVDSRAVTR